MRVALACGLLLGPGGCDRATAPHPVAPDAAPSARSGYAVDITATGGLPDTTRITAGGGTR
ncbi:MAG TPA: hypothetical protein VNA89_13375 [Gemmatimonadaceae bacterium]|nr:hypothetical protein [Gemmatimonadaceae bacterium]